MICTDAKKLQLNDPKILSKVMERGMRDSDERRRGMDVTERQAEKLDFFFKRHGLQSQRLICTIKK